MISARRPTPDGDDCLYRFSATVGCIVSAKRLVVLIERNGYSADSAQQLLWFGANLQQRFSTT
jgi:hypothetical protein